MISVFMKAKRLPLQEAINEVDMLYQAMANQFLKLLENLPQCSSDKEAKSLKEYIRGMANWVTANVEWSYSSERYFGKIGPEVKKTWMVELWPREIDDNSGTCNIEY